MSAILGPRWRMPLVAVLYSLALIAYTLPWVRGTGVALSYGAYDFAEWTSLHPLSHAQTPALLTPLLLRLPPALLALALAFGLAGSATVRRRILLAALVVLTALALLPPLEFFTVAREDPNFRQQALLTLVTFVAGIIGTSSLTGSTGRWTGAALAVLAGLSGLAGLIQGSGLVQAFALPSFTSAAGPLFALACVALAVRLGFVAVAQRS